MATLTDLHRLRGLCLLALSPLLLLGPSLAQAGDASGETLMGEPGRAQWRWVVGWGQESGALGSTHGCLVVDRKGRILVNTDTEAAVVVFGADGQRLDSLAKEFRGGLHGMTLRVEGDEEFLYLAHTGRHEVVKATMDGKVLWTMGVPEAAGIYANEGEYRPTAVVSTEDGRIFVADGYGKSWVHLYDADRVYQRSIGGRGEEDGKFRTPHGLTLDDRPCAAGEEAQLLVCDRENHRLQWFTLKGQFVRKLSEGLRRPCNAWILRGHGMEGWLAIADLTGCVTILDQEDKLVTVLGDNAPKDQRATNGVGRESWQPGRFFAPHSVCQDATGALYVMDWNATGRVSKLELVR